MNYLKKLYQQKFLFHFNVLKDEHQELKLKFEETLLNQGKILAKLYYKNEISSFEEIEFSIFSQFGDDGIIQYLIQKLEIKDKTFIEFGVENYSESNTRFLMMNNNWQGLVIDGSIENIKKIRSSYYFWQYSLQAESFFIKRENINAIFTELGYSGEIGLLHIDIDGNDYWVWDNIQVVDPVIVIIEYNSVLGLDRPITIPYEDSFMRNKAHHSNLYWGSSLPALCYLGQKKGYDFVGSNSAGNNAYFVRKDKNNLKPLTAKQGYKESKYRESRTKEGELSFLMGEERLSAIKGLPVINVETGQPEKI